MKGPHVTTACFTCQAGSAGNGRVAGDQAQVIGADGFKSPGRREGSHGKRQRQEAGLRTAQAPLGRMKKERNKKR